MTRQATVTEIVQELNYQKEKAERSLKEIQKLPGCHSSYGAGVEEGEIGLCERMIEYINDPDEN